MDKLKRGNVRETNRRIQRKRGRNIEIKKVTYTHTHRERVGWKTE